MEVWLLYLYLGSLGTIEVPGHFDTKADCIERGTATIEAYKKKHTHSAGFFWCVESGKYGS